MSVNRYDADAVALGLILVIAGWLSLTPRVPRLRLVRSHWWDLAAGVLCVVLTTVAGGFAYFGAYRTGWDPSMIEYAVAHPSDLTVVNAYSTYPNLRPDPGGSGISRRRGDADHGSV